MAGGSIAGTIIGGLLVGVIPDAVLIPLLAAILLASAASVWRHQNRSAGIVSDPADDDLPLLDA